MLQYTQLNQQKKEEKKEKDLIPFGRNSDQKIANLQPSSYVYYSFLENIILHPLSFQLCIYFHIEVLACLKFHFEQFTGDKLEQFVNIVEFSGFRECALEIWSSGLVH